MVNHLTIQGRLTRDLELRKVTVGQDAFDYVDFTVVWNEKSGDGKEKTLWQNCKAWRGLATFMGKWMHTKGTELIVEGRLITEQWTDKDGNKRSNNVLLVDHAHFCGKRQDNTQTAAPVQAAPQGAVEVEGEPLPF